MLVAAVLVALGSLIIALAFDGNGAGAFTRMFAAAFGLSFVAIGVGTAIASAVVLLRDG